MGATNAQLGDTIHDHSDVNIPSSTTASHSYIVYSDAFPIHLNKTLPHMSPSNGRTLTATGAQSPITHAGTFQSTSHPTPSHPQPSMRPPTRSSHPALPSMSTTPSPRPVSVTTFFHSHSCLTAATHYSKATTLSSVHRSLHPRSAILAPANLHGSLYHLYGYLFPHIFLTKLSQFVPQL